MVVEHDTEVERRHDGPAQVVGQVLEQRLVDERAVGSVDAAAAVYLFASDDVRTGIALEHDLDIGEEDRVEITAQHLSDAGGGQLGEVEVLVKHGVPRHRIAAARRQRGQAVAVGPWSDTMTPNRLQSSAISGASGPCEKSTTGMRVFDARNDETLSSN